MGVIRTLLLATTLGAAACAHRVEVSLPASPAVALRSERVAVVYVDGTCANQADALVGALRDGGLQVDPNARVRLEVSLCEGGVGGPEVEVEIADGVDHRRIAVDGRAWAVLQVYGPEGLRARLLGAAAQQVRGPWSDESPRSSGEVRRLVRTADEVLVAAVADDLAEQVRTGPREVARRLYGRAPEGSGRALYNAAIHAEHEGRVTDARRLAHEAWTREPNLRIATYLLQLDRRVALADLP